METPIIVKGNNMGYMLDDALRLWQCIAGSQRIFMACMGLLQVAPILGLIYFFSPSYDDCCNAGTHLFFFLYLFNTPLPYPHMQMLFPITLSLWSHVTNGLSL